MKVARRFFQIFFAKIVVRFQLKDDCDFDLLLLILLFHYFFGGGVVSYADFLRSDFVLYLCPLENKDLQRIPCSSPQTPPPVFNNKESLMNTGNLVVSDL